MDSDAVPPVDLDAIVASYAPNAAIARLLFVADRAKARDAPDERLPPPDPAPDAALELDALRHAHDLLRASENTSLYVAVCERIGGRLGDAYSPDKDWVDAVDARAAKRLEMLESELAGYKTNAIKESIRMGHVDLGDFHRARGDAANAFKSYARTRDYCTTNRHVVSTCLNVVRVGVESGNFAHVQTYCAKAASAAGPAPAGATTTTTTKTTTTTSTTPMPTTLPASAASTTSGASGADPCALAELARAAGVAALHARKYALAARKFSEACRLAGAADAPSVSSAPSSGGDSVSPAGAGGAPSGAPTTSDLADEPLAEILCARDVATCGALCGVASLEPAESRERFAEDPHFRAALDHSLETRAFVQHFFAHRFAEALEVLEKKLAPRLAYDAHLAEHASTLCQKIREKALARFCAPYAALDLTVMASAFHTDLSSLKNELVALILSGDVKARIDGGGDFSKTNPTLRATKADGRRDALLRVRRAGKEYVDGVQRALVRASLLEHDLVVGGTHTRGMSSYSAYGSGSGGMSMSAREARRGGRGSFGLAFGEGSVEGSIARGGAGRRFSAGGHRDRDRASRGNPNPGSHTRGQVAMDHD